MASRNSRKRLPDDEAATAAGNSRKRPPDDEAATAAGNSRKRPPDDEATPATADGLLVPSSFTGYNGIGEYMAHKRRKLDATFASEFQQQGRGGNGAAASAPLPPIFAGVRVWINGATDPPFEVLRRLVGLGSGTLDYTHAPSVTHIIATNLPDSKVKEFRAMKRRPAVVLPAWVLDSMSAGTRLPESDYTLPALRDAGATNALATFLGRGVAGRPAATSSSSSSSGGAAAVAASPARSSAMSSSNSSSSPGATPFTLPQAPTGLPSGARSSSADGFLPGFFQASRLHLLGSWKAYIAAVVERERRAVYGTSAADVEAEAAAAEAAGAGEDGGEDGLGLLDGAAYHEEDEEKEEEEDEGEGGGDGYGCHNADGEEEEEEGSSGASRVPLVPTVPQPLPPSTGLRVIAHIDMDCFFATISILTARQREGVDYSTRPVVVAHTGGRASAAVYRREMRVGDGVEAVSVAAGARGADGAAASAGAAAGGGLDLFGSGGSSSAALQGAASAARAIDVGDDGEAGGEDAPTQLQAEQPRAGSEAAASAAASAAAAGITADDAADPRAIHAKFLAGGEVSSANYPARKYGIRAGMTVGEARALCPPTDPLVVLPYNFEAIKATAEAVAKLFVRVTPRVQVVSIDEAYLDVSSCADPVAAVSQLRADIFTATTCTASAGVGPNLFLARLATARAKPNGMHVIPPDPAAIQAELDQLEVAALPGVGYSRRRALAAAGIETVAQLRAAPASVVQRAVGPALAASLAQHAVGHDPRRVTVYQPRKTVGAEVNWGVRFNTPADAAAFLKALAKEVVGRLAEAGATERLFHGAEAGTGAASSNESELSAGSSTAPTAGAVFGARCVTIKLMRRKAGSGAPRKFLGHGICDNFSRSIVLPVPLWEEEGLYRQAQAMYNSYGFAPKDVRGVGVELSRLEWVVPQGTALAEGSKSSGGEVGSAGGGDEDVEAALQYPGTEARREGLVLPPPKAPVQTSITSFVSRGIKAAAVASPAAALAAGAHSPSITVVDVVSPAHEVVIALSPTDVRLDLDEDEEEEGRGFGAGRGKKERGGPSGPKLQQARLPALLLPTAAAAQALGLDPGTVAELPAWLRREIRETSERVKRAALPSSAAAGGGGGGKGAGQAPAAASDVQDDDAAVVAVAASSRSGLLCAIGAPKLLAPLDAPHDERTFLDGVAAASGAWNGWEAADYVAAALEDWAASEAGAALLSCPVPCSCPTANEAAVAALAHLPLTQLRAGNTEGASLYMAHLRRLAKAQWGESLHVPPCVYRAVATSVAAGARAVLPRGARLAW